VRLGVIHTDSLPASGTLRRAAGRGPTTSCVRRKINTLDLRSLLANLNDPDELSQQINAAVTKAVKDSLTARLRDLL
jgi:hypothetical protein